MRHYVGHDPHALRQNRVTFDDELPLNVTKDGGPLVDVVLLDLASGDAITKAENGTPVFGWVASEPSRDSPAPPRYR